MLLLVLLLPLPLLRRLDVCHVGIKYVGLCDGAAEACGGRGFCRPASLAEDVVLRLGRTLAEVELIPQRILDGHLLVVFRGVEVLVDSFLLLAPLLLLLLAVLDLELVLRIWTLLEKDLPIQRTVKADLIHLIILLEGAVPEGVGGDIVWRPWVVRVEHAGRDLLLQLLRAQDQLVLGLHLDDDRHVIVIEDLVFIIAPRGFRRRRG
mmetsp:Transcript_87255/g.260295  ORF Transcript_87255/g.260295 Transcript_87255/m.260295 type:complete len:207 (-) Transcript_87255:63-683(-)